VGAQKNPEKYYKKIEEFGFDEGEIIDISTEYLEILKNHDTVMDHMLILVLIVKY